jgi:hypothetical protein
MDMHGLKTFFILFGLLLSGQAFAWGDFGHRMTAELAIETLPESLPAFLRQPQIKTDVGEFIREPDRWRGAGKVHDTERDPAHYIDLYDDGLTFAGVPLTQMPATRSEFDAAVRARGLDPAKSGYLYYAIIDGYQQLTKDFGYWRFLTYLSKQERDGFKRQWYKADLKRREALIARDLGVLAHYVTDATQPMHMSIHFNGWGEFPNPEGFSQEKIHGPLESTYVTQNISKPMIKAKLSPMAACSETIEACTVKKLIRNHSFILPLFRLEKDGGFKPSDARGIAFMTDKLAQATSDLRDVITDAWVASESMTIGYPAQSLADLTAGRIEDPFRILYGERP